MSVFLFAALFVQTTQPPVQVGPPVPPPVRPRANGETPPEDGEIVVTGERYDENSPYRVPMQFRNQRSDDDRHASWDARTRDLEAVERFSSQNVGPSGISQHSRQVDCQWRAARQEMRGERPDCGKGLPF